MAKQSNRHNRIFNRLLAAVVGPFLRPIFRYRHDRVRLDGPTLILCNHVTNFDPLLLSLCYPKDHTHFVCSEHLFRLGFVSRFLRYVFDPIPRRKGASGADTAMAVLRKLRAGRSVSLFVEGECSWDGVTAPLASSTGRLVKMSGATLMTFRFEGGYLTAPRWGKGLRPGRMTCRLVGQYSPQELKTMDPARIEEMIRQDLHTDIWQEQAQNPVAFRSRRRAENLQTVLYLCPHCHRPGKLAGKGKTLSCACGKSWEFTEFGSFSPAEPFENILQWDTWQKAQLPRVLGEGHILEDENVTVFRLDAEHGQEKLCTDRLTLKDGILCCGQQAWPLEAIEDLGLVQSRNLLMSVGSDYYQLKAAKSCCLRKYREAWEIARARQTSEV